MPAKASEPKDLILPRLGAVIVAAAIVVPALRLPLILGCLAALGNAALSRSRARDVVPETPPARRRNAGARRRRNSKDTVAEASEDSFPASDPPSWTPVSGTGTRH